MYAEDELIPISALQHYIFCPRQWGLIHLEQAWEDNRLTAEGNILHERTHSDGTENRPGLRIARSLRLCSYRLGIVGQADVVEFCRIAKEHQESSMAIKLADEPGLWNVLPVEYKRGKPKSDNCDKVQLCAQALCLEEMLNVNIRDGALFYGRPRRRYDVILDDNLRTETETLILRLHELRKQGDTPKQRYSKKCDNCSLINRCMPKVMGKKKDVEHYLMSALKSEAIE